MRCQPMSIEIVEYIEVQLRALPEIAGWTDMGRLVERLRGTRSMSCLDYPLVASRAVGGQADQGLPGSAAIFCMLTGINLVDDMLDRDPRGDYHRLGEGPAANLALAFQAASFKMLSSAQLAPALRASALNSLAEMSLATAYGQHLDTGTITNEEEYWRVVQAKTAPLFSCAFYLGAVLGGGSRKHAAGLSRLGDWVGRIVQLSDDVGDALHTPAKPDWRRGSANLPILYASLADHPQRGELVELLPTVEAPEDLESAQRILVRCGAISFCFYHVIQAYREAQEHLSSLKLPNAFPVEELLERHVAPLRTLLREFGVESPSHF